MKPLTVLKGKMHSDSCFQEFKIINEISNDCSNKSSSSSNK